MGQGVLAAVEWVRVYWLLWSGSGCIDCCGVGQGVLTVVEWVKVYKYWLLWSGSGYETT